MPVPSDSMLMDEQVWQENAYLVKLLLTCGLSGSQLVPKLDSFVILISWIEVCTSDTAYIMLQVNNWEKSEFCLDFVDSISRETDCPTPCQRALAACWLSPRYSSSLAFLKAIHADACANWYMSTILLQGICLTLELLNNQRFRISKID